MSVFQCEIRLKMTIKARWQANVAMRWNLVKVNCVAALPWCWGQANTGLKSRQGVLTPACRITCWHVLFKPSLWQSILHKSHTVWLVFKNLAHSWTFSVCFSLPLSIFMFNIQVFGFGHWWGQDIELGRPSDWAIHECCCVLMPVWMALNLLHFKNNLPW